MWDAVTEIVVHSMNKGQMPAAFLGLIIVLLIARYPNDKIPALVTELLNFLKIWKHLGWLLSGLTIALWFLHVRSLRRQFSEETERIGKEKSRLQEVIAGRKFSSSNER